MARTIALSLALSRTHAAELARLAIVTGCALALVLAGQVFPAL